MSGLDTFNLFTTLLVQTFTFKQTTTATVDVTMPRPMARVAAERKVLLMHFTVDPWPGSTPI